MAAPSLSSPARLTASAAARPPPAQPSDRAACAARRPSSADSLVRSPHRAPFFALRHGGLIHACGPGFADPLAHLGELLADRREFGVPGDLAADLFYLRRCELPADGAASRAVLVHKNRGPCPRCSG